ncbi:cytochrome P450 CYP72A219-like isoform X2 [Telopea speciosissima]|uniref:cytochrome P450 CYP72A219-like isoform X2 n=1 Tax=Telopea speciosissima TaxID=54955 RepID=UPI001CC544A3|nr:cytochrome P450 CYP72A219-like isoform X2 [Telopea speciosissima]
MGETVFFSMVTLCILVVLWWGWKVLEWIWWRPKKLERHLKEQGIKVTPYKLLVGDLKEFLSLFKEAKSKPMNLSHDIVPRVFPFHLQTILKYGKNSAFWFGTTPRLYIMDPNLIREIMSNKFGHFAKIKGFRLARYFIGGVAVYEGEKWAKHRRIINPAFHVEKLKRMLSAFYTSSNEMVNKWEKLVTLEGSCELDVWPELQNLTGDVISRAAFGSSYEEGKRIFKLQDEQGELIIRAFQTAFIPGFSLLPTKKNRRIKEIDREVRTLLMGIINKRQQTMKVAEASNDDLLGLLLESNDKEIQENKNKKNVGMSIEEVIQECKLFYFAGQETTSVLLVWTMVVLSMHSEWQVRAREEVLQVFGKNKPDYDGLNHLKIVTMILYEVLRLYPPVLSLDRCTYKNIKLGEISLPPGIQLMLPIVLLHHDQEVWGEDAKEFKPERFAEGISKATKNQVSFFPFGWGPRICIGQQFALTEAKMALAMILQRFAFELSPSYAHAPTTIITLHPQHGAQIILHKL